MLIEDAVERLFAAAERAVAREGAALTSRAITAAADCAKGALHTHFAGLDEFAAVADNLQEVVLALMDALPPAVVGPTMTRPAVSLRTREGFRSGAPAFDVPPWNTPGGYTIVL